MIDFFKYLVGFINMLSMGITILTFALAINRWEVIVGAKVVTKFYGEGIYKVRTS